VALVYNTESVATHHRAHPSPGNDSVLT